MHGTRLNWGTARSNALLSPLPNDGVGFTIQLPPPRAHQTGCPSDLIISHPDVLSCPSSLVEFGLQ